MTTEEQQTNPLPANPAPYLNLDPAYGVIEGFLGQATVDELLTYADLRQSQFVASKAYNRGVDNIVLTTRSSLVLDDLGPYQDVLEQRFRAALPELIALLGGASFESQWFEFELVAHNDGAFFKRHNDTFSLSANASSFDFNHRAISMIYYFHRQPKAFTGGELRLYSLAMPGHEPEYSDITPRSDSLVFFPSWFEHEVLPVSCPGKAFADSRFALNCWVHDMVDEA